MTVYTEPTIMSRTRMQGNSAVHDGWPIQRRETRTRIEYRAAGLMTMAAGFVATNDFGVLRIKRKGVDKTHV